MKLNVKMTQIEKTTSCATTQPSPVIRTRALIRARDAHRLQTTDEPNNGPQMVAELAAEFLGHWNV